MNIDFHFHTCLTKITPFDLGFFQQAVQRAREQGLGAIGITDHHDNTGYEEIYGTLDRFYAYNGHYYLVDGVRFYPGIEVATQEGPHLLASGPRDDILTYYDRLRPHLDPETYPTVAEFFALQDGLDLFNTFAHPLRERREFHRVDPELVSGFDALDLNAKDLRKHGPEEARARVEAMGREHNLPVLAGSDTHHFYQLGCVYNTVHHPFESIADLRRLIYAGAYTPFIQPNLREWVEKASAIKKAIKAANGQ